MVIDDPPRGTKHIYGQFDQSVVPRHPRTDEPMPPPFSFALSCSPESVGWARARMTSLINSTGWKLDGEMRESFLYREDEDADRP